jgi:hypothetical protein
MNLRTLKKLSKQAVPVLVAHYGRRPADFFLAEKGGNYHGLKIRCHHKPERIGTFGCDCRYHPLKGTPMLGEVSGHEEPEWSERTAWDELHESVRWTGRPATMTDVEWVQCQRIARAQPITSEELDGWWGDEPPHIIGIDFGRDDI